MKHALMTGLIGLSTSIATCCDPPKDDPAPAPPRLLYIGEGYNYQFDARPGDTLILVMNPDGGQLDRCNQAGGELIEYRENGLWYCENIDF